MAEPSAKPVYLIELMDPHLGTLERADVTAFIENALMTVYTHLLDFHEPVDVEVSVDTTSGELAGIVFFSEEAQAISVIRPFYLSRDEVEGVSPEVTKLAKLPLTKLEPKLNQLFKQR